MATINEEYQGVFVRLFKVEMEIAETTVDVPHGLGDYCTVCLNPKDAGFYTQAVILDNNDQEKAVITKTAGAIANFEITFTVINAPRNG